MTYMAMENDLSKFGLIVVPEAEDLEPELIEKLKEYVKNGGNLLIASPMSAEYFKDLVGATWAYNNSTTLQEEKERGYNNAVQNYNNPNLMHLEGGGHVDSLTAPWADFAPTTARTLSVRAQYNSLVLGKQWPISIVNDYGKGKVGAIGFDFGKVYNHNNMASTRGLIKAQLKELFPEPLVKVSGSLFIDISIMDNNGQLTINLMNRLGGSNIPDIRNIDEIPPLYDIDIKVQWDGSPAEVYAEPEHQKLDTRFEDGRLCFRLDRLHIHTVITVEKI